MNFSDVPADHSAFHNFYLLVCPLNFVPSSITRKGKIIFLILVQLILIGITDNLFKENVPSDTRHT